MASPRTSDLIAIAFALGCGIAAAAEPAATAPAPSKAPDVAQSTTGTPLESIVAVVNDDVILASELESEIADIRARIAERGGQVPPERLLRRQVLERLVAKQLQLQLADHVGVEVHDDELDGSIAEIANRNNMTLEQLSATVEKGGIHYADYRESVRKDMLIDRVRRQEVERRVVVTPREVDQFMATNPDADDNEYDVSHILIALHDLATADEIAKNQERAQATYDYIVGKKNDFGATATAYSDAPDALEGGSLGWRRRVQLPTAFADMVVGMQPGDVSKPFRSAAGFHIIKLNGVRHSKPVVVTQYHVRHILIRPTQVLTSDKAKAKLDGLRAKILAGADFGETAKLESEDPGSKSDGGDLGWTEAAVYVPAFQQVLTTIPLNELSQPFQTQFGWHILQVLGKRDADVTDQAARNRATGQLRQRKLEEQGQLWLQRLRDEAFVEIRLQG